MPEPATPLAGAAATAALASAAALSIPIPIPTPAGTGAWATGLGVLAILAGLVLLVGGLLWGPPMWRQWRRQRLRQRPFPAAWREVLRRRFPAYAALPTPLQLQLKGHIQVLLAEKAFIGCDGQLITDEVRVLIAAQAALLLLNRPADYYPGLRQVLVYPGAFVVARPEDGGAGLVHEGRRTLAGESWQQGQVLLSWTDVLAGAAHPHDGRNVVIHEFAHQLDQARGGASGVPFLGRRGWAASRSAYARWAAVLSAEFHALQARLARGEAGLIDPYAATNPAEFFAVVSEHFFEQPHALAAGHPVLYREFTQLYRSDPRAWDARG